MTFGLKYLLYGIAFGLCFPIVATILSAQLLSDSISIEAMLKSQLSNPLLWMIDTAPIFLGLLAYLGGLQYDKLLASQIQEKHLNALLEEKNAELESKVKERTQQLELNLNKLTEANQIRTEFIATVSHELRTPLTAIGGAVKLIKSNTVSKIDEQGMELISLADRNTKLLVCLVDDLLDIEKLEAGKLQIASEKHLAFNLVKQAVEMNQAFADTFNVNIIFNDEHSDVQISVDKRRFIQILLNLLSNACKFSLSGSDIVVSLEETDKHLRICVADLGDGVPAEFSDKLFDKFTQVDSSNTRSKGGTGLGLNISKSLVRIMDGDIGYYPNQPQGSVFYIEFPVV